MIIRTFEQTVRRFAKDTAIVTDSGQLTYEEVNKQANNLARAVLESGSIPAKIDQPEIVGLLFEYSADMVVSVLGTLKAGKAYLPLDITYPESRLVYMLEDSGAGLLLTNNSNIFLAERLAEKVENKIKILNIDSIDLNNSTGSENIERDSSGDKMAYILYTSGSTGKPKGVMQTHENVCYYIKNWTRRFSITHTDRMTLFTAFSHDGAGQDMFGALHNGAVLYPYSILNKPNIHELIEWLNREKITIWHSVPTIYRYFVNTLEERGLKPGHFPYLRFILLGGEQIRDHDIRIFKRFFPGAVFANVYGQTESSVNSIWLVRPGDLVNKMLIGEPLDKTEILIVDDEGEIVEGMGMGEIVVACKHLSPGYWKNIEASKEKFFNLPELGPIYRTGDLGRLMADGSIECIGRKDAQVKIRGFRIETGEIETRLLGHEAVKEVVVVVKRDNENNDHICAYYVAAPSAGDITVSQLRNYLADEIPEYMIPSYFIRLGEMPLTPNGKIDRLRLPEPEHIRPKLEVTYVAPETSIEKEISEVWKEVLKLDKVGVDDNFFDLGGTSFDIIRIMSKLYYVLKKDIPVTTVFRYPTIRSFVRFLKQEETVQQEKSNGIPRVRKENEPGWGGPVAVVGMSLRFPGSKTIDEFWENLKNGVESISHFSYEELEAEGIDRQLLNNPNFVRAKGIIGDIGNFDAAFFGYSPTEARVMDPQLRIMHEVSWEALEDAGCDPETYNGLIGLYAGNAANHYWMTMTYLNNISLVDSGFLINNYSTIVSYRLNLKGPSFILQTACSTSLVAIHLACRGLIEGECDIALAGGVSIWYPEKSGYIYQEGMIYSPDGHCRTFDSKAGGTVFGNGAGMVALKRLDDAIADGNTIHAVVRGTGINNDGRRKVGFTSPSVEGQSELIERVLRESQIDPESISYVEAHGTATVLGDPVELEALSLAYNTKKRGYCRIGSVKSNVGHLNIAAGVAGFIKAVLAIKYRMIPPTLNYETPNPRINFENSPFVVNNRLTEWKSDKYPLRAAVSAFGIGGTNAHTILEEPPEIEASSVNTRPLKMIFLSATSRSALERSAENLGHYLEQNPGVNLADVAYTLQVGRKTNKLKKMLLCSTVDEAVKLLLAPEEPLTLETGKIHTGSGEEDNKRIVFMFSGQGAQYVDMGLELYRTEPVFRAEMDRCFTLLKPHMTDDLKEILYRSDRTGESNGSDESYEEKINRTENTQPVLFIFEYALAKLLMHWGIKPYAMIGHSIGEYVAACLAGVFSLEDAVKLVALRGQLMQRMPGGAMVGVSLPEEEVIPLLTNELALAAVNTTSGCVVSGPYEAVDSLEQLLKERGHNCRRLHTSHAFHSGMMDPILEEFEEAVSRITLNEPSIPYISNVTGNWISVEEAANPVYWSKHLRSTVRFADGLTQLFELFKESDTVFIEVGPGRTLDSLVRQHKDKKPEHLSVNLIRHPKETVSDSYYLLSRIGRLWLDGKQLDFKGFYSGEKRHRIPLPLYPFQRQRYWLEGDPYKIGTRESSEEPITGKRPDIADWFYVPSWKTSVSAAGRLGAGRFSSIEPLHWLLLTDDDESDVSAPLVKELLAGGHEVVIARRGNQFNRTGNNSYTINPEEADHYQKLLSECTDKGKTLHRIVHLWNLSENVNYRNSAFYSLLYLVRAISAVNLKGDVLLSVITDRMQPVMGKEVVNPEMATIIGALEVISVEYPNIRCSSIDLDKTNPYPGTDELIKELYSGSEDIFIAFRDKYRWVRTFDPIQLEKPAEKTVWLREGGVYLVTGGLGGIGLVLAEYLAKTVKAKLILTGRSAVPPREEWEHWLNSHSRGDSTSLKIRQALQLEEAGAEVMVFSADAADRQQMQEVLDRAVRKFGTINGVIHSAGVPGGGFIQNQNEEKANRVFSPKIDGTLVLDSLLTNTSLDFFMLCSSVSAVTGTMGQVAYSAANAFMDSFAHYRTARDNAYTVSINWDAWQEVGMAAKAVQQLTGLQDTSVSRPDVQDVDYPLFEGCEILDSQQAVYISRLRADKYWIIDEHRAMGKATFPGTGYLEMTRAAFEDYSKNSAVVVEDFLASVPLMINDDEEKEVRTILTKNGEQYSFSVISRLNGLEDKWIEHARGKVAVLEGKETERFSISQLREKCSEEEVLYDPGTFNGEQGLMVFGPRWNNLREVLYGRGCALGFLELPDAFAADIDTYKMHPALLDVGNVILKRRGNHEGKTYVPAYYKRLRIKGALPSRVYFYVTDVEGNTEGAEALRYNITVMDENGVELVDIEEYTLRKVSADTRTAQQFQKQGGTAPTPDSLQAAQPYSFFISGQKAAPASKADMLKDALTPSEGIDVFLRILGAGGLPQVIVSTIDLPTRIKMVRTPAEEKSSEEHSGTDASSPKFARPELSSEYVPPRSPIEKVLVPIWEDLLGIEKVGIYDDFFELGGDSLKAVNFGTRIHKQLNTSVPVSEFFARPNIKMLAEFISGNSDIRQFSSIVPTEKKGYYPLSSAQVRFFVLNRLEGKHTGHNLATVIGVEGHIDINKIAETFRMLIRRHENLRTSFLIVDGNPVQRVHEYSEVKFVPKYFNCSEFGESDGNRKSHNDLLREFVRPFDLAEAPLIRAGLIKKTENSHIMIVDIHHIVFDGLSYPLFFGEFIRLYSTGEELPPLTLQYKDYVQWHNSREVKEARSKQENFWTTLLADYPPFTNLPLDYPRPPVQAFEGSCVSFMMDKSEINILKTLYRKNEATLFMVLAAIVNILLMKLSGQEDILVGTPVGGRVHTDLEPLLGMFINTLVMRNFPARQKTFENFLMELKERSLAAFENQEYPFEELVEKVVSNRDLSRNPLFDVMFILNTDLTTDYDSESFEESLKFKVYEHERTASQFDMTFTCFDRGEYFYFEVEYCTKLFKEESIRRFISFFKQIAYSIVKDPAQKLGDIEVMTGEEKARLLKEFNDTELQYPENKTIHRLFKEQADIRGEEIAVIGKAQGIPGDLSLQGHDRLTYEELDRYSDRLALRLREGGVRPGKICAVMLKRTPALMVGLLGILKAGGAYLPLDPEYPDERIKYILQKSEAHLLLTWGKEITSHGFDRQVIDIFDETLYMEINNDDGASALEINVSAEDPAYIIYTSGSTGNPKGVVIRHRNAVNFIGGMTAVVDFSPRKTILALTTISFDISFLEILLPVTRGMKVVVADEEQQKDPASLKALILENRIDIMQVTPSRLQLMLEPQAGGNFPPCVGELLVGGEAFPAHLFGLLKEIFNGRVYNVYGPTETTVWSTVKDLTGCRPEEMTIGRPIANTRVYIVNPDFHLQPVGVPGELFIGGDGVAAGYLNNVELTAEKFFDFYRSNRSYWSNKTYSTIYRTGDLARWLSIGEIEFLGRLDHQVKIRGFRIELEEIEEQLLKHENIKEAVVTARTGRNDEKYLCAYFVTRKIDENSGNGFNSSELRDRLSAKLPPYMIPSHYVQLDSIPLTPNGKIDRQSLPEPDASRSNSGATYIAPKTGNELIIAQLWKEILQIDDVGVNDNFFDLGGNSLNVIQLNWKLKEKFGTEIPVALMFRNLSISFLDSYLSRETEVPEAEKEIDRTEALEKAQKTFKNTISKFAGNRRNL